MSRTTQARSKLGLAVKDRKKNPTAENAKREQQAREALLEAKVADCVNRALAASPPLSEATKARLADLLTAVK